MRDKVERGRQGAASGESNGQAKVPDELVCDAVAMIKSGMTQEAAAQMIRSKGYPCTGSSISNWVIGNSRQSALKQSQAESSQGEGGQLCLFD